MWLAIGLAAAGAVAIIVEAFVPAAGLIGAAGLGSIVASVVVVFRRVGTTAGSIYLGVVLVLVPVLVVLYFRYFPRTFAGRWLISPHRQERDKGYTSYTPERYGELLGKEGVSLTIMRPVGTVLIEGRRYSAVTSGEYLEKDQPIRVVRIEGSRIVVRGGG
jgi:membrane-bound serine protease (ClpP class)